MNRRSGPMEEHPIQNKIQERYPILQVIHHQPPPPILPYFFLLQFSLCDSIPFHSIRARERGKMMVGTASMALGLQSSMASLSISSSSSSNDTNAMAMSSSSFFGQRLALPPFTTAIKFVIKPCPIEMRLRRWELKKYLKPNGDPMVHKMHVKVGDTVQIITGREKGKVGEIIKLVKYNSTVIVKDMNLKTKHIKGKEEGQKGEIVQVEGPIHSSNVMLYSKEKNVASRVGHKVLEDGTKVRYLIKTGEIIDSAENWKKLIKEKEKDES